MTNVEASQVVPSLNSSVVQEDMYEKVTRVSQKKTNLKIYLKRTMKDCQRF